MQVLETQISNHQEQRQHDNRAILRELEQERELLSAICFTSLAALGTGLTIFGVLGGIMLAPSTILLKRLEIISRQFLLMQRLIDAFENEGVEIHPRLQPPNLRPIDFFLRFPDKKFIALMIGSQGESVVSFNQKKEILQYRSKRGGLKDWKPDPLSMLNLQVLWLGKERRDLKGGSSKDAIRPVAKMLMLWGATRLGDHNEDLYSTMAGYKVLWIKKFGSTCIVEEDQVIEAIKAYLAKEQEQ